MTAFGETCHSRVKVPESCEHEGYESNFKFSLGDAVDGGQYEPTRVYQCPKCKELVVK